MTVTFYNILNVHIQHTNNVRELLGAACAELEAMMFRTVSQAFVRRQQAPYGRYWRLPMPQASKYIVTRTLVRAITACGR